MKNIIVISSFIYLICISAGVAETEKIQQTWPNRNGRPGNDGNSAGGKAIQDTLITQHASWGPHVRPHTHSQDGLSDILKCIKSVHERKKEKSLWENTAMMLAATFNISITLFIPPQNSSIIKNYFLNPGKRQNPTQHAHMQFNSPMNICCPIIKNTSISPYHGILTPFKFNFRMFINKFPGRTYLKSNLLKGKAAFHDYEYKGTNISRTIKNILHKFIKMKEST